MRLGVETMKMLRESDYASIVEAKGAHFLQGLRELQRRHPEIGDVDGLGLALRAEICERDGFTPNKKLVGRMVEIGLSGDLGRGSEKLGLVLDVGGYHKNVVTFAPSLHITADEIELAFVLFDQVLTRAKRDLA